MMIVVSAPGRPPSIVTPELLAQSQLFVSERSPAVPAPVQVAVATTSSRRNTALNSAGMDVLTETVASDAVPDASSPKGPSQWSNRYPAAAVAVRVVSTGVPNVPSTETVAPGAPCPMATVPCPSLVAVTVNVVGTGTATCTAAIAPRYLFLLPRFTTLTSTRPPVSSSSTGPIFR